MFFSSEAGSEPKTLRENMYDTLPRSLKSDLLVRVRDEDPEVQRQRQELTRLVESNTLDLQEQRIKLIVFILDEQPFKSIPDSQKANQHGKVVS